MTFSPFMLSRFALNNEDRPMIFNSVPIVGSYFRGKDVQALVATLEVGTRLRLEREPDNTFDQYAIKAFYEDVHIGYVAANIASWIAPKMDEGLSAVAQIEEMAENAKGNAQPMCEVMLVTHVEEVVEFEDVNSGQDEAGVK